MPANLQWIQRENGINWFYCFFFFVYKCKRIGFIANFTNEINFLMYYFLYKNCLIC